MAGLLPDATDSKSGLMPSLIRQNSVSHSKYWVSANSVVLVASIQAFDIVELLIATGEASFGFNNSMSGYTRVVINNRSGINTNQIRKENIINEPTLYFDKTGDVLNVYVKTSSSSYNYVIAKCTLSMLGIVTNRILKMEVVDKDVSTMTAI